jgi:hypothetical protein
LREAGHDVYDFRNPTAGNAGFSWSAVGLPTSPQPAQVIRKILSDARCNSGFDLDMNALRWCDACVLVQPSGRSAHLELGWAAGARKRTFILLLDNEEPDLMYKMVDSLVVSIDELIDVLRITRATTSEAFNRPVDVH